jgi:two-component system, sensor histidine kinase YesM
MQTEKNKRTVIRSITNKIKMLDNISLSQKLILSYVLIIAIPIIIFSFIAFKKFENTSRKEIVNKNINQLELESVNINRNIETLEHTAQMVASNRGLMDYLSAQQELSVEKLVEFNNGTYKNMLQMQYSNPNIRDVSVFTNNKDVNEIWPLVFYADRVKSKDWYEKVIALKGSVFWNFTQPSSDISDLSYSQVQTSDYVVSVYRSLQYPQSTSSGIIRVSMPAKVFFPKMYGKVSDMEGQIYIVDNENNIYTNDNSKYIKEKGISKELIKEQFLKNKNSENNSFNINYNKKHMIVVYTKIESLDSYMLSVASIDSMLQYTSLIRNIFMAGTLVLIIILSVVTYIITSIILKRLYIIVQSMKRIQQGDFDIEIPLRSNDEIGELAHHFRKMLRKINELIQEAANKRAATKEVELRALQTQIDSHFIYNTLENIKMLAEIEEQYVISDSITSLGAMMRYNMKWNSEYVTLRDETDHIKNYLALMNMRFDNIIKLELNIDEKLLEHDLLKMSLQPIVENSIKHGLRDIADEKQGLITINGSVEGCSIKIEVMDNGVGIEMDKLLLLNEEITKMTKINNRNNYRDMNGINNKASTGIGLKNVNERIKLFYGNEYGIEVESQVNLYTKVIMTLPY